MFNLYVAYIFYIRMGKSSLNETTHSLTHSIIEDRLGRPKQVVNLNTTTVRT